MRVCSISQEKVAAVAAARAVRGTTDYAEVLAAPDVDAVAVLIPHPIHHEAASAALAAGKHVYVEKPITVTPDEARDLIETTTERGLTLAVTENTRYVRAYIEARAARSRGRARRDPHRPGVRVPDQILDEWADMDDETPAWKREPSGCGAIMDCAPHMFDLLTWFFGEVSDCSIARGWVPEVELDNHSVITGKMVDGPLFALSCARSRRVYPRSERGNVLRGSGGTLIINQSYKTTEWSSSPRWSAVEDGSGWPGISLRDPHQLKAAPLLARGRARRRAFGRGVSKPRIAGGSWPWCSSA